MQSSFHCGLDLLQTSFPGLHSESCESIGKHFRIAHQNVIQKVYCVSLQKVYYVLSLHSILFFLILEEIPISFWCAILKYLPNDSKNSEFDKAVVHTISLISFL